MIIERPRPALYHHVQERPPRRPHTGHIATLPEPCRASCLGDSDRQTWPAGAGGNVVTMRGRHSARRVRCRADENAPRHLASGPRGWFEKLGFRKLRAALTRTSLRWVGQPVLQLPILMLIGA